MNLLPRSTYEIEIKSIDVMAMPIPIQLVFDKRSLNSKLAKIADAATIPTLFIGNTKVLSG